MVDGGWWKGAALVLSRSALCQLLSTPSACTFRRVSRTTHDRSFLSAAKLIGVITLLSRILGYAREKAAAHFFGAGPVWSAFVYAFTIPNLFRKLLGEGALSQAFIPLYAKSVKRDDAPH